MKRIIVMAACALGSAAASAQVPDKHVDRKAPVQGEEWMNLRMGPGSDMLYSSQQLKPEGQMIDFGGRFCSIALARGGKIVMVKTSSQLVSVDADSFKAIQGTPFPAKNGGSMHGLAVSADGTRAYVTGGKDRLFVADVAADGKFTFSGEISLAERGKPTNPLGLAIMPDGRRAIVARSIANDVVIIDLATANIEARVPVGVCPYGVAVSRDGQWAFVSNYGGTRPTANKGGLGDASPQPSLTEKSAGTAVAVDKRTLPLCGTVSVISLAAGPNEKPGEKQQIHVRMHPSELLLSPDGKRLYVTNVGGDSVSVIDALTYQVIETIDTKPDPSLPWGSLPDGLALAEDGQTLYVADAGINAVACIPLAINSRTGPKLPPRLIPAGWTPGGLCVRGKDLFVSNVRNGLQKVVLTADETEVAARDAAARSNAHLAFAIRSAERSKSEVAPVPVPVRLGEPSVIKHVVYIVKENKTYDQMLGDIGKGNSEPKLCLYHRDSIPNHKSLATTFALLDNYYCNGVNSADGHQWCMQGLTTPYREKDRDGFRCAYDFGTDELCYAGCGFMWDLALMSGRSFRNYGELDYPSVSGGHSYNDFYTDWKNKTGKTKFRTFSQVEALRRYSCPSYPGWEMAIPDQVRADAFLKELAEFNEHGKASMGNASPKPSLPDFVILYLPEDHTAGELKPQSYLADNDLAMGRCVEGLSKSRFWKDTAIFIIEDDPQSGQDHVDGHRSICLLASPWAKRGVIISKFYNECTVLHTICQILGLPPLNQMVAAAPLMSDCFQDTPDMTPYKCLVPEFPLNAPKAAQAKPKTPAAKKLAAKVAAFDFSRPDLNDDDALNRAIWAEIRPGERYPAEFSGPHGKGLKALGLKLADIDGDDD